MCSNTKDLQYWMVNKEQKEWDIVNGSEYNNLLRVDEVIYPAPWILDEKFLNDNNIDYVAHDDIPYATADVDDAYALCKKLGKFKVDTVII